MKVVEWGVLSSEGVGFAFSIWSPVFLQQFESGLLLSEATMHCVARTVNWHLSQLLDRDNISDEKSLQTREAFYDKSELQKR